MKSLILILMCIMLSVVAKAEGTDSVRVEYKYYLGTYYYKIPTGESFKYLSLYKKNKQDFSTIEEMGMPISEDDYNRINEEKVLAYIPANMVISTYTENSLYTTVELPEGYKKNYFTIRAGFGFSVFSDDYFSNFNIQGTKTDASCYGFDLGLSDDYNINGSKWYVSGGLAFSILNSYGRFSSEGYYYNTETSSKSFRIPVGLKYYIRVANQIFIIPSIYTGMAWYWATNKQKNNIYEQLNTEPYKYEAHGFMYSAGIELKFYNFRLGTIFLPRMSKGEHFFAISGAYDF